MSFCIEEKNMKSNVQFIWKKAFVKLTALNNPFPNRSSHTAYSLLHQQQYSSRNTLTTQLCYHFQKLVVLFNAMFEVWLKPWKVKNWYSVWTCRRWQIYMYKIGTYNGISSISSVMTQLMILRLYFHLKNWISIFFHLIWLNEYGNLRINSNNLLLKIQRT